MMQRLRQMLALWVDALAAGLAALLDRLRHDGPALVAEWRGGVWTFRDERGAAMPDLPDAGADAVAWLRRRDIRALLPDERLFRASLPPVPEESREFLPAVVDLRVDRIAPWARQDRLTGFRARSVEGGQIVADVAVTARFFAEAIIDAAIRSEARSLSITGPAEGDIAIDIPLPAALARKRALRRIVVAALGSFLVCVLAGAGLLAWQSFDIDQRRQMTEEAIGARMAVIRKATAAAETGAGGALDPIDSRKQGGPLAVITLEALSRLLPDDTYLVSLRYDGTTVRVAGFTRSFPQLVPILVGSPYFSDARFNEPTERQADGSDRFAIELVLRPTASMEAL